MRRVREQHPELPPVVFVHQGSLDEGAALIDPIWPEAPAISDQSLTLFRAFGLGRGKLRQIMGPRTFLPGLRALMKGHLVSKPIGDIHQMPGLFLCNADSILWSYIPEHSGEFPSDQLLVAEAANALSRSANTGSSPRAQP